MLFAENTGGSCEDLKQVHDPATVPAHLQTKTQILEYQRVTSLEKKNRWQPLHHGTRIKSGIEAKMEKASSK